MENVKRRCPCCRTPGPDKGRATDGRRAYRCTSCRCVWTEGMQGRIKQYSSQRQGYQFADSGAAADPFGGMTPERSMAAAQRLVGGLSDDA